MIKLFSSVDTLFSSNGDKIIIPIRAKVRAKTATVTMQLRQYYDLTNMGESVCYGKK